jgi:hypothetical protein
MASEYSKTSLEIAQEMWYVFSNVWF